MLANAYHTNVYAYDVSDGLKESRKLMSEARYSEASEILKSKVVNLPTYLKSEAYSDLGVCSKNMGLYYEASYYFDQALDLAPSNSMRDKVRYNYSNYLIETGNYPKAIELLNTISLPSLLAPKFINLSHAFYLMTGDLDKSLAYLDSCMSIAPDVSYRNVILQNKGYMYSDSRNYDEALMYLSEALEGLPLSDEYYQTLGNIALVNARLGNTPTAQKQIESSMGRFKNRNSSDYRISVRKAAEIALIAGSVNLAGAYFKEFFSLEKKDIITNLQSLNQISKLNLWLKEKTLLSKCFLMEGYDPEFLFDVAVFRRLTSLLGVRDNENLTARLNTTSADIRRSLNKDEVAIEFISYENLDGDIIYAAVILPKKGSAKYVKLFPATFLDEPHTIGRSSLIKAIEREHRSTKNQLYNDSILAEKIWSPIIKAIPRNVKKIYFAPEGVFHFLGIENMSFSGREKFDIYRFTSTASLINRKDGRKHDYRALLVGGLDYSSPPADTTNGVCNHDASNILRQKVAGGNVFQYLPGTRREVDSISKIVANPGVIYQAGEAALKKRLPEFDLVHIATHGYSLNMGIRRRPEFMVDSVAYDLSLNASGLALSGANLFPEDINLEDGLLSAREICDLDLSGVDFVVLSACQSAQGDLTDEGPAGLVRGLKNAGVKTVMATLWSVDDKSTMLFMQEFYRLLESGMSKHEAYIGAQNFLKNYSITTLSRKFSQASLSYDRNVSRNVKTYNEPWYWAPFILIDDF